MFSQFHVRESWDTAHPLRYKTRSVPKGEAVDKLPVLVNSPRLQWDLSQVLLLMAYHGGEKRRSSRKGECHVTTLTSIARQRITSRCSLAFRREKHHRLQSVIMNASYREYTTGPTAHLETVCYRITSVLDTSKKLSSEKCDSLSPQ